MQKKYYDRTATPTTLKVGDSVLYYNRRGYKGKTSKLIKRWTGVYIIRSISATNAEIQLFDDPDSPITRVHLNNLKLYRGPLVRGDSAVIDIDFDDEPTSSDATNVLSSDHPPTESKEEEHELSHASRLDNDDDPVSSDGEIPTNIGSDNARSLSAKGKSSLTTQSSSDDNDSIPESDDDIRNNSRYTLRRRPRKKRDSDFLYRH